MAHISTFVYPPTPNEDDSLSIPFALVSFAGEDAGAAMMDSVSGLSDAILPHVGQLILLPKSGPAAQVAMKELYEEITTSTLSAPPNSGFAGPHGSGPPGTAVAGAPEVLSPLGPPGSPGVNYWMARLELVSMFGCSEFVVTDAVLGPGDQHIHYILNNADHRVSVSLKGVPANDAPVMDRLHIAIQSTSKPHFDKAVDMTEDLLQTVCDQFVKFSLERGLRIHSNLGFIRHAYSGVQVPDGSIENMRYLGHRERAPVWLQIVPAEMITQHGVGTNQGGSAQHHNNSFGISNYPSGGSSSGGMMGPNSTAISQGGTAPTIASIHHQSPVNPNVYHDTSIPTNIPPNQHRKDNLNNRGGGWSGPRRGGNNGPNNHRGPNQRQRYTHDNMQGNGGGY